MSRMEPGEHGQESQALVPDPESPLEMLAFLFCPVTAFTAATEKAALREAMEIIRPIKAEAVRRWVDRATARRRS